MRPETQKQIVKAFAMMYEDSDMSLDEYIEKLQQLNGQKSKGQETKRVWRKVSDEEILEAIPKDESISIGKIRKKLSNKIGRNLLPRLNNLVSKEKVMKEKIHPRLCYWKKL